MLDKNETQPEQNWAGSPAGTQRNSGDPFSQPSPAQKINDSPFSESRPAQKINDPQDQSLMSQARETTGKVVDQVQEQATSKLDEQKKTAAQGLQSVADAVRQAGHSLKQQGHGGITTYASEYGTKAAAQIERVTNYLRQRDANAIIEDVQDFARRKPAYFLGGAFLLGFAGVRFLKSSTPSVIPERTPLALPPASSPQPTMAPHIEGR
jgi:hypothetical protein